MSDENRFRIVSLLASEDGELTCGAIGKALSLSPSLLSHHLSILAQAGIIGRRKNGLWTMNVLERPMIERQLAALDSLICRNGCGEAGEKGDPSGSAVPDGMEAGVPGEAGPATAASEQEDEAIAGS